MQDEVETIPEGIFWDRYKPVETVPGSGAYTRTFDDIKAMDPKRVWTIVEGADGTWIIEAGMHVVNKIGYLITSNPWETGIESGYYMDPGDDDDMYDDEDRKQLAELESDEAS